jgi:citrate lyase subunit beta/citryl-CoA lyase
MNAKRVGEAGHRGDDVRSDCHVRVELRGRGGVELELISKVEPYYGRSIREQVHATLAALGIEHARVAVQDAGALPFTLAARTEAAARAAGAEASDAAIPGGRPQREAPPRERLRRSRLYLPGAQPKFFVNAKLHAADAVILDLEDSVHSDDKPGARLLVRNALRAVDFGACERMVRINQLPLGLDDLEAVLPEEPDLILIPKVETADQVQQIDAAIAACGPARDVWIMPILESALGVENATEIARASTRTVALTIGLEDYTADLGVVKTSEGAESLYARSRLVNAARAAGIAAIDSVYGDVEDTEGLRAYGMRSRAMGFEGMGCIHPRQIPVIHEAFAPGEAELQRALRIVAAFEEAEAHGRGVVSLGSKMIDPPVVKRALHLVRQARALGLPVGEEV